MLNGTPERTRARSLNASYLREVLIAALLALLGSLVGVMIVFPLGGLALADGADGEPSYDAETRRAQMDVAVGQLVGVAIAVGWYAGLVPGAVAGLAAAMLAWVFVPRSRALETGFVALVPAVLGGALAAALATALLG